MSMEVMDQAKVAEFGKKMGETLNAAGLALMLSIGHRTKLFDAFSRMEKPAAAWELADAAGLSERYVREWLGAMVTGGVVEYDPAEKTYVLPPEHAALLTRDQTPNAAASMQWVAVLGAVEDEVVAAFRHGRGVPYSAYKRFHEVMAEESAQSVAAGLFDHVLPLVPGLTEKLERGIRVLDIGCGAGQSLILMAETFPASTFVGYDMSPEAIAMARMGAALKRLKNIRFEVQDVAEIPDRGRYDLVTAFDVIHDQAKPAQVLRRVREALAADGTFLMQDIKACTHVHDNIGGAYATFIYTISCMHCMSVSLANGGPGLGAAWGKEKACEMIREAGFTRLSVNTLPHDELNYWYVVGA